MSPAVRAPNWKRFRLRHALRRIDPARAGAVQEALLSKGPRIARNDVRAAAADTRIDVRLSKLSAPDPHGPNRDHEKRRAISEIRQPASL
jgi:hypothetical protein